MYRVVIAFVISISLIGCFPNQDELNELKNKNISLEKKNQELTRKITDLQKEIKELKKQVDDFRFGAERLLGEARLSFEKKEFEDSIKTINLLREKHPASKEAAEGKLLLAKVEKEIKKLEAIKEKEEKEKERKRKAEELARKRRLANALKQLSKQYDEVEKISWYYPRRYNLNKWKSGIGLYIGGKGNYHWLRLKLKYAASDWLFVKRVKINIDSQNRNLDCGEFERDHSSVIWEWCDKSPSELDLLLIKDIIKSKKTIIRFSGQQYRDDHIVTKAEKRALQDVLDAFEVLSGKAL